MDNVVSDSLLLMYNNRLNNIFVKVIDTVKLLCLACMIKYSVLPIE